MTLNLYLPKISSSEFFFFFFFLPLIIDLVNLLKSFGLEGQPKVYSLNHGEIIWSCLEIRVATAWSHFVGRRQLSMVISLSASFMG